MLPRSFSSLAFLSGSRRSHEERAEPAARASALTRAAISHSPRALDRAFSFEESGSPAGARGSSLTLGKMKAFQLLPESERTAYRHLLEWARGHARSFHLVRRHGLEFAPTADAVRERLQRHLLHARHTRRWAGTQAAEPAEVSEYLVSDASLAILAEQDGVLSWLYPQLDEDLAFFASDGRCLFNSVSHHEEIWLCDSALIAFLSAVDGVRMAETNYDVLSLTVSDRE